MIGPDDFDDERNRSEVVTAPPFTDQAIDSFATSTAARASTQKGRAGAAALYWFIGALVVIAIIAGVIAIRTQLRHQEEMRAYQEAVLREQQRQEEEVKRREEERRRQEARL